MPAAEPSSSELAALRGRLQKRHRHLSRWAAREGLTAYRLFDRDIPGWHFAVDRYDRYALVAEYPWKTGDPRHLARRDAFCTTLAEVCGIGVEDVVLKSHARSGEYEKSASGDRTLVVEERPLKFEVNLGPYLDVGLFLDQRTVRRWVRERSAGRSVANFFCYTGSFTVAAAVGGARRTLSVDLSATYLTWAERNLRLNGAAGAKHRLVEGDAAQIARDVPADKFDLVICDPPPASVSKRARRFEVQADHAALLEALFGWLSPGGALYFACNLGGFTLAPQLARHPCRELTPGSLPEDFRGHPPHRAWLFGDPWLVTG